MSIIAFPRIGILTTIGLFLTGLVATPTFAESKKLDSVGLTVGDLGNPFFVQIAHGAEAKAQQINGKVKARLEVAPSISEDDATTAALADADVVAALSGAAPSRVVSRPPRLVNIIP